MSRVEKKLKSERGASITFALLLFLVCAVLCSVIITAASTASGRMSKISEMDQRYFSVTSASELVRDLIDGETVSVVKKYKTGATGTRELVGTYLAEGDIHSEDDFGTEIGTSPAFDAIPEYVAYLISNNTGASSLSRTLTVSPSLTELSTNAYKVTIDMVVQTVFNHHFEGNMKLTLYNKYTGDTDSIDGNRFKVILNFELDNKTEIDTRMEEDELIENEISSFTWNLTSIQTNTTS